MKKSRKILTFTAAMMTAAMLTACHETVYGPPAETVYGPPKDPGLESEVQEDVQSGTESFLPESNIVEEVYGPPVEEDGAEDGIPETLYGPPPEEGSVENSVPETVYGPPSFFGR